MGRAIQLIVYRIQEPGPIKSKEYFIVSQYCNLDAFIFETEIVQKPITEEVLLLQTEICKWEGRTKHQYHGIILV